MASSIRTRRPIEWSSAVRSRNRNATAVPPRLGGVPAPNLPMDRVQRNHAGVCLYMRDVRIVCGEDWKDESFDMRWVKRIIVFLIVAFFLFYLVAQPEAAANAVRGIFNALARVFRSVIVFFQSLAG